MIISPGWIFHGGDILMWPRRSNFCRPGRLSFSGAEAGRVASLCASVIYSSSSSRSAVILPVRGIEINQLCRLRRRRRLTCIMPLLSLDGFEERSTRLSERRARHTACRSDYRLWTHARCQYRLTSRPNVQIIAARSLTRRPLRMVRHGCRLLAAKFWGVR